MPAMLHYEFITPSSPYYIQALELRYAIFFEASQLSPSVVQDEIESRSHHLVAVEAGKVVGYIRLTVDQGAGRLSQFMVAAHVRGKSGIAKALYQRIVAKAQAEGVVKLIGEIRLPVANAARRLGFKISDEVFPSRTTGIPHRRIEKWLGDNVDRKEAL